MVKAESNRPLLALGMIMLLPSLGTSIANVALPTLETAFSASFRDVQWVVLSYLLSVTTMIVGIGRLGDLLGRRRLLLIGIGVFFIASFAAAVSPNLGTLVTARAAQGLGAAAMMSLAVASVGDAIPKERTGTAMGLLGTVSAVGTALGPSLGGALLSVFGWQALFITMAIAGGSTFLVSICFLPSTPQVERSNAAFDFLGMLTLAVFLGGYALWTTLGLSGDALLGAGLAVVSALALGAFVIAEGRAASPIIRIEVLAEGGLGASLIALALVSTIMMSTLVVGPFYLTRALGLSVVEAGLVMSIGPAVAAVVGLPSGRLVDAYGAGKSMIAGLLGVVVGTALLTILPNLAGTFGYVLGLVFTTAGYALFQAANNAGVMSAAAADRKGVTSALLGLSRNLGLISGASAMGAVFAVGSSGTLSWALGQGPEAGLQLTFAVAFLLAIAAVGVITWHLAHAAEI